MKEFVKAHKWGFALLFGLNVLDAVTTEVGLSLGGIEKNETMLMLMEWSRAAAYSVKVTGVVLMAALVAWRHSKWLLDWLVWTFGLVVFFNLCGILNLVFEFGWHTTSVPYLAIIGGVSAAGAALAFLARQLKKARKAGDARGTVPEG